MSKNKTKENFLNKFKFNPNSNTKRLVVKNRKKIAIIVSIVVILITGLGVGLYFSFKKVVNYPDTIQELKEKDAKNKLVNTVNNADNNDIWGLYVGSSECPHCNSAIHGDGEDTESMKGPFSTYLNNTVDREIEWYRFSNGSIAEQKEKINNLIGETYLEVSNSEYLHPVPIEMYGEIEATKTESDLTNIEVEEVFGSKSVVEMSKNPGENNGEYEDGWNGLEWGTPTFIVFAGGKIQSYVSGFSDPEEGSSSGDGMTEQWFLTWESQILNYLK